MNYVGACAGIPLAPTADDGAVENKTVQLKKYSGGRLQAGAWVCSEVEDPPTGEG